MKCLEDDPTFNAGHGSVLNEDGEIEMDAIITDGGTLNFGAVAAVKNIANPVSLARAVMEKTKHVMLAGEGVSRFAHEVGVPEVNPGDLVTERRQKQWEEFHQYQTAVDSRYNKPDEKSEPEGGQSVDPLMATPGNKDGGATATQTVSTESTDTGHDTVGAVAIDLCGGIAAATSTGGISRKQAGRVGDSPLVGSGAYCDNKIGGVSTTGHGEGIAKVLLATRALTLLEYGKARTAQEAVEQALTYMWSRVGSRGGLIMITKDGTIAKCFTTQRMSWASVDQEGKMESSIEQPRLQPVH